jgi:hypothetical protein
LYKSNYQGSTIACVDRQIDTVSRQKRISERENASEADFSEPTAAIDFEQKKGRQAGKTEGASMTTAVGMTLPVET